MPSPRTPIDKGAGSLRTAVTSSRTSFSPGLYPSAAIQPPRPSTPATSTLLKSPIACQSPRPVAPAASTLLQSPIARTPASIPYSGYRRRAPLASPISIRTDSDASVSPPPSPTPNPAGGRAAPLQPTRTAPASLPAAKASVTHIQALVRHSRDTVPWVNPRKKFTPLYEDETDEEGGLQDRVFRIPNPKTMKPPTLSEVGKSDYYVVTRGQGVGVFGSL